jgi:hypothetical protein
MAASALPESGAALGAESGVAESELLRLPEVGSSELRVIAPTVLELTLVTTKKPDPAKVEQWDFVDGSGKPRLPEPSEFKIMVNGKGKLVKTVGFRRRVLYAPFKKRDLRIGNYLYLKLSDPIQDNATVEVTNPGNKLWQSRVRFLAKADPFRWSPALHVNQTGYFPAYSKKAMVGYYLGNLGELDIGNPLDSANVDPPPGATQPKSLEFAILDARTHREVFHSALKPRPDVGWPIECYQHVMEADFSRLKTPGEYVLFVPGFGVSFPFLIDDAVAGAFARTTALGIYHQRCGTANELPFTRFTHGPCHTAPAEVPDMSARYASANDSLAKETANFKDNPRHKAPQLKNIAVCLYPFVNRGPVDVRGGHHDAGDYSKYTIDSAAFIHHLVFAADVFPGVVQLDNLGLPESGDGKSDVLEEAKWEADFLAKMQDADGGFYFLVYPRDREYENDVTPDHGDPQVVFPKTTSVTAAAVAALAQCSSSPAFKREFPEAAKMYLSKAKLGWSFLEKAISKYGQDGAYQKITHYGDEFMHDDELAWAACELFLATGDEKYHVKLQDWLHPSDPATRRWGWWRLFESYGCAIRSYAFAAKAGKLKPEQQNPVLLDDCQTEIAAAGQDQLRRAQNCAYGTSFPNESKRAETAGWYFSSDAAFDLAVAMQLDYPPRNDPRPQLFEALLSNLNYEQGCNPVNVSYMTGLGWKRQHDIVDQYEQNARHALPPGGIPLGNLQAGFGWLDPYKEELGHLSFPSDGAPDNPYPIYDRWGDSFNLSQEFVILNQARELAYLAWLMAQSPLKAQAWRAAPGQVAELPAGGKAGTRTYGLTCSGQDVSGAQVVWEAEGREPVFGQTLVLAPGSKRPGWVEVEAELKDGRRVFGALR